MIDVLNLNRLHKPLKQEFLNKFESIFEANQYIGGDEIVKFEMLFSKMHNIKNIIGCANGTDALYIALKSLQLPQDAEVLVPSHTWISSSETVTQAGYKPIFVDSSEIYLNSNSEQFIKKVTEKTKAIIAVHLYGNPIDIDVLASFCKENKIRLIEDCAQAHFAKYKNKFVGTFGDVATFSFFPGKNLGALGDAGAVATKHHEIAEFCKIYPKHGAEIKHHHLIEGINSRLDNLQAAFLNIKLKYIQKWTERRRAVARFYETNITNENIILPNILVDAEPTWHQYTIQHKNRNELQAYLKANGINSVINYPTPLPYQQAYSALNYKESEFPHAVAQTSKLLCIPICPTLTSAETEKIVETINEFN